MHILSDRFLKPVAYIYNNIILLPGSFEVIGVKLGDCVFGTRDVKGKYFNSAIYSASGEIVAMVNGESGESNLDSAKVTQDAWKLITGLKDHVCPWIVPNEHWSATSLENFLRD